MQRAKLPTDVGEQDRSGVDFDNIGGYIHADDAEDMEDIAEDRRQIRRNPDAYADDIAGDIYDI